MLNLPVPEAEFINEVLKPSEEQQEMVSAFSERAEEVRAGLVNPTVDNMLKITNDGRKCALDQRLLNELLPDAEKSKVNTCVENAFQVWDEGKADRTTQLIFCDLSTPKGDGMGLSMYMMMSETNWLPGESRKKRLRLSMNTTRRQRKQICLQRYGLGR